MVYFLCKAYDSGRQNCCFALSLPVRGAWVEIFGTADVTDAEKSLPVRGAWVEILRQHEARQPQTSRSPCGERGLKYILLAIVNCTVSVAPRAGSVG